MLPIETPHLLIRTRSPDDVPGLIALIDPENGASARVAEKVGMRLEREVVRPGGALRQVYALD